MHHKHDLFFWNSKARKCGEVEEDSEEEAATVRIWKSTKNTKHVSELSRRVFMRFCIRTLVRGNVARKQPRRVCFEPFPGFPIGDLREHVVELLLIEWQIPISKNQSQFRISVTPVERQTMEIRKRSGTRSADVV